MTYGHDMIVRGVDIENRRDLKNRLKYDKVELEYRGSFRKQCFIADR